MKKKSDDEHHSIDPSEIELSWAVHEFLHLYKDFMEIGNKNIAEKILSFLRHEERRKSLIEHARFNPHEHFHESVESDIEALETSINSWMKEKVSDEVVVSYLKDLRYWLIADNDFE